MTRRLRYHILKLRALCGVLLAAPARGAPFFARGVVSSWRKTSRVVIARTIIDGHNIHEGIPRLFASRSRGNKAILAAQEIFGLGISSKLRQCPALAHNG